jgi:hypothetical protein
MARSITEQTSESSFNGVVEKHNFCGIQQKIPQKSDFALKRDLNPVPHIEAAVDIEKMFEQNLHQK